MIEIILAVTQAVIVLFLLVFFYKREHRSIEKDQETSRLVRDFAVQQAKENIAVIKSISTEYLKHIQKLETINVPKPVTQKSVQEILDRTPPMAEPNSIDKSDDNGFEITEANLGSIPIGDKTKVVFEGNDFPTEIL